MPRRRLINVVNLFFMACLVLFYVLALADVPLGVIFFLWVGIFNLMVVAQFWSFANDIYALEEGKRLFVIVAFGASLGAAAGSQLTNVLIEPLGIYQMLLVSCAILGLSLVLTNVVDAREKRRRTGQNPADKAAPEPATEDIVTPVDDVDAADEALTGHGGFSLVLQNRYLLKIALMLLLANWVNTTGEYILGKLVTDTAAEAVAAGTAGGLDEGEWIGKFYSGFFLVVNIVSLLIQLFLVSRIIKYLGIRLALMILPLIALGSYSLLIFMPVLSIVRWTKTAENATDYSLQNTVRNILFLPTTREEKYKAKQAIDTFYVRMGDVLSALLVYLGTTYFALGVRGFSAFSVGLIIIWLLLAFAIGREYMRKTADREP
jgi:AAA family ATP:ADP antiporter